MSTQQEHSELASMLAKLCTSTVAECKAALAQQKANNLAEANRVEEEEKLKAEKEKQKLGRKSGRNRRG